MAIGTLAAASPSGVFPKTLFIGFSETRIFPQLANTYHDGTSERGLIIDTSNPPASVRAYKLSVRCTSTTLATFKTFWTTQQGGLTPFYFYNPYEATGAIGSNYDSTGISVTGRHICRFTNQMWSETDSMTFADIQFDLLEVA